LVCGLPPSLSAVATDLAEFLGAALGFYLLFGINLFVAALITAVLVFLIAGRGAVRLSPPGTAHHGLCLRDCGMLCD